MKWTRVQGPDGGFITVQHPEGATEEQILSFAAANYAPKPVQIGAAGLGQAAKEVGEKQTPVQGLATGIGNAALRWAGGLGNLPSLVGAPKLIPQEMLDVGQETQRGAGMPAMAGNMATNIAGALALPGAFSTAPRAALTSAAIEPDERVKAGVLAGGLNLGMRALTGSLVQPSQQASKLLEKGIVPTYGQSMASKPGMVPQMVARTEEKAQSIPFVGDFVTNARMRALEDFRRSAIGTATPQGAQPIKQTGVEGIQQLQSSIGSGYDAVYGGAQYKPDIGLLQGIAAAPRQTTVPLSEAGTKTYWETIKRNMLDRLPDTGLPTETVKKTIESDLGKAARSFKSSANSDERAIGDAVLNARQALRDSMARGLPPEQAAKLGPLNQNYFDFKVLEKAAERAKAQGGAFSPFQLQSAAPQGSPMRDLANTAQAVLPTRVPNSFSADRGLLAGAAGLLGPGAAGAYLSNPYLAAAGLAPLMYSRPALAYMQGMLTPAWMAQVAPALAQGEQSLLMQGKR